MRQVTTGTRRDARLDPSLHPIWVLLPFLFVAVALASPSPFPIHLDRRVHVPIFGSAVTVIDNLTLPSWPESTSTATRDTPSSLPPPPPPPSITSCYPSTYRIARVTVSPPFPYTTTVDNHPRGLHCVIITLIVLDHSVSLEGNPSVSAAWLSDGGRDPQRHRPTTTRTGRPSTPMSTITIQRTVYGAQRPAPAEVRVLDIQKAARSGGFGVEVVGPLRATMRHVHVRSESLSVQLEGHELVTAAPDKPRRQNEHHRMGSTTLTWTWEDDDRHVQDNDDDDHHHHRQKQQQQQHQQHKEGGGRTSGPEMTQTTDPHLGDHDPSDGTPDIDATFSVHVLHQGALVSGRTSQRQITWRSRVHLDVIETYVIDNDGPVLVGGWNRAVLLDALKTRDDLGSHATPFVTTLAAILPASATHLSLFDDLGTIHAGKLGSAPDNQEDHPQVSYHVRPRHDLAGGHRGRFSFAFRVSAPVIKSERGSEERLTVNLGNSIPGMTYDESITSFRLPLGVRVTRVEHPGVREEHLLGDVVGTSAGVNVAVTSYRPGLASWGSGFLAVGWSLLSLLWGREAPMVVVRVTDGTAAELATPLHLYLEGLPGEWSWLWWTGGWMPGAWRTGWGPG